MDAMERAYKYLMEAYIKSKTGLDVAVEVERKGAADCGDANHHFKQETA